MSEAQLFTDLVKTGAHPYLDERGSIAFIHPSNLDDTLRKRIFIANPLRLKDLLRFASAVVWLEEARRRIVRSAPEAHAEYLIELLELHRLRRRLHWLPADELADLELWLGGMARSDSPELRVGVSRADRRRHVAGQPR